MQMRETAYAKINLALHVRRRREDGYHELETLFAFAADGDCLTAEPADMLSLSITGPFAGDLEADESNLVLRAAKALQVASGTGLGAAIVLDKRLPVAAGIGGGSADAAAALRLLARLWDVTVSDAAMQEIAVGLGADVPGCLQSRTVFGSGVGERLAPFAADGIADTPLLLVNPLKPCPTGPVFKAWDGVDRGALDPRSWHNARNDLEAPATGLVSEIADVIVQLTTQSGAHLVRMSGSGATCFALFNSLDERDKAATAISASRPDWWLLPTVLR
ncbi:MAG: 4-(cytidine 5'-diphospho)-2-C-methyl-D-erythritol kinase [Sphingomonadales bacterium]|jgi:4-diphosphocytidyl-2-C-methyl-D-erythritol kinase|nr:4-(cytidine 5'-diphospho)-2-C-methyl-D-erythritol kinase [Sphingomonadales bacterium]MBK9003318.1 4-(cytidine 5'-diphospho)-2-C-methyl-D-erythritol kinase [Sphingomonadales bacterium]MBK9268695.1 4-(cytidine 5'-diphospho)-2-C-methyl-D-erythritol kinase [Sphingomonadales bacterium]MBP6433843.1 4-(cytidine 5'-diphospho)-2-C-methyl-D-erythritol kinase [Sphingorhabdus sp.]